MESLTYEQFVVVLRSALHHLYDPVQLRRSRLIDVLNLGDEFDTAAALGQILTSAIHTLKPADNEQPHSSAWRIYDALHLQYIRQYSSDVVAMQLGISERQLRRERRKALEALTQHLWQQLDLSSRRPVDGAAKARSLPEADKALNQELAWLKDQVREGETPIDDILYTVLELVQPLARRSGVQVQMDVQTELSSPTATPLALRSILLTVLNEAIPRAGRGPLKISAARSGSEIEFKMACLDSSSGWTSFSVEDAAGLETAQDLASFYGARLSLEEQVDSGFVLTITLPTSKQIPVLIIDDNNDWLELLQRYAAASKYRVTGTDSPGEGYRLAAQIQPAAVLLDVMMQNIDGWQVLSELRQDPETREIPVVICTILPVRDLALSLGADAFLQKPASQEQFLHILDQHTKLSDRSSTASSTSA